MNNIFSVIEDRATPVLKALKLTLPQVREDRGTRVNMSKRSILYSYLRNVCGYTYGEIAFYTHKETSTIRTNILTHKELWEENKEELLTRIQEI